MGARDNKNNTDMKLYIYLLIALVMLIASRLISHYVPYEAWSIALYVLGFIPLGIYAWKCDKLSKN